MTTPRPVWLMFVVVLGACGGSGSELDLENRDPRCVSACKPNEPAISGAGAVCNTASQVSCLDECEVRIAGTMTACASCLVEKACLTTGSSCSGDVTNGDECANNTCITTGPKGSCMYPAGNQTARENCRRQVDPLHEVACTAKFRPTTECASLCGG